MKKEKKIEDWEFFGTLYGKKFYFEKLTDEERKAILDYLNHCRKIHFCDDKLLKDILQSEKQKWQEGLRGKIKEMKRKKPPSIKQEIWGGERGYGNIKIESSDILGEERVQGFNQAIDKILDILDEKK